MLLVREYRDSSLERAGDKLNFLGGKRLRRETGALKCAVDKVDEETAGQLSRATISHMREGCPLVCWNRQSKYVFSLVSSSEKMTAMSMYAARECEEQSVWSG